MTLIKITTILIVLLLSVITAFCFESIDYPLDEENWIEEYWLDETIITQGTYSFSQRFRIYLNSERNRYYQKTDLQVNNSSFSLTTLTNDSFPQTDKSYSFNYKPKAIVDNIIIGKYRLEFGQGLAYAPPIGLSKSSQTTTQPVKNYQNIKSHYSPYQMWSLEGIAARINLTPISFIPFYSDTYLNARLNNNKILTFYPYGDVSQTNRKTVREKIGGAAGIINISNSSFGIYASYNRFNKEFSDNNYRDSYLSSGAFYMLKLKSCDIFGELAYIDRKSGMLYGIRYGNNRIRQVLIYRRYDNNIPTYHGNPFSAQTSFANEEGVYYGISLVLRKNLVFNAYYDLWKHPATRYFEKMPSYSSEQYLSLSYRLGNQTITAQLKHKSYDKYSAIDNLAKIREERRTVYKINLLHHLNKYLSFNTSLEHITRYIKEEKIYKPGTLISQYIQYKDNHITLTTQVSAYRSQVTHYYYIHSIDGVWENKQLSKDNVFTSFLVKYQLWNRLYLQSKASLLLDNGELDFLCQLSYKLD